MSDITFEIQVPDSLLRYGYGQHEVQDRVTQWLVLSLFTEGHISSGKAARLLDISRLEFLALLRVRGIAYVDYTKEELEEEFAAVQELEAQSGQ
jgi:predicted HTH domain antitoxin